MPMTIYKLYGFADGDSIASLDIQMDGDITAVHMSTSPVGFDALDDAVSAECSFLSSNSFGNSDTRGSIMIIQSRLGMLTQGGCNSAVNAQISSMEVPVAAGERIHLHIALGGGTVSAGTHAYLYVRDKGTPRIPGRRR